MTCMQYLWFDNHRHIDMDGVIKVQPAIGTGYCGVMHK